MKEYLIKRIEKIPDWKQIPSLDVNNNLWLPETGIQMTQQICYNRNGLYIHQCATENDIRAQLSDPLAQVCEDSCMEFFFCPDISSNRYFNFEFNPNRCLYLGWNDGMGLSVRLHPQDPVRLFQVNVTQSNTRWELFYHIPASFIRLFSPDFELTPEKKIKANCYKCGDKTAQPHYLAWNPSTSATPNFHRPCDFGVMVLGE